MNMIKAFETRIAEAFGASQHGHTAPFSFKKLAKRTAREMERETYVINGTNTAPALITVLVSADDDAVMRTLYPELTDEISKYVEAEAARKGYVFVGKPLARFMVDPSLRRGRFAVFANNVDAPTLDKLRIEEEAFLSGFGTLGGAASPDIVPIPDPSERPQVSASDDIPVVEHAVSDDSSAGLNVLPADFVDESLREAGVLKPLSSAIPQVIDEATPIVTPVAEVVGAHVPEVPQVDGAPAPIAVPQGARHGVHNVQDDSTIAPAPIVKPEPSDEPDPITCLLIDRQSGRTYVGTAPSTIIGRERTPGGIILHDPNVSRRHAELTHDGRTWRIRDLGSTNGTLVNDVDVESCVLRDGDLITLGLLNLEFRES